MAYRSVEALKNTARQGKSETQQPSKQTKASQTKDSLGPFEYYREVLGKETHNTL
jgi:hypothetical protein